MRRRLDEIAAVEGVLGERVTGLESQIAARIDETAAALSTESTSRREAIDGIALRLGGLEHNARSTPETLQALRTELMAALSRLEAVESAAQAAARAGSGWTDAAAALGSRLNAVEQLLARDDDRVEPRLTELERRLDAEASQADERVKVTERALRKGLATLGERLSESESAYAEAGDALRRSIERLGRVIVETDTGIARRDDPDTPATREIDSYVAFAPTAEGYRLLVVPGDAPEVGHTVELAGHDSPLVVTRVGASPIPLDDRPCAYLEPAASPVSA